MSTHCPTIMKLN